MQLSAANLTTRHFKQSYKISQRQCMCRLQRGSEVSSLLTMLQNTEVMERSDTKYNTTNSAGQHTLNNTAAIFSHHRHHLHYHFIWFLVAIQLNPFIRYADRALLYNYSAADDDLMVCMHAVDVNRRQRRLAFVSDSNHKALHTRWLNEITVLRQHVMHA